MRAIENLEDLIYGYGKEEEFEIELSIRPEIDDGEVEAFFKEKGIEIQCHWGKIKVKRELGLDLI